MRGLLAATLVLAASVSANSPPRHSMAAMNVKGPAHLCPTGPNEAFTARHVATIRTSISNPLDLTRVQIWFSTGIATATSWDEVLDIARLTTTDEFSYHFRVSAKEPKVGDKVTVTGYNYEKGATQSVMETKIENFLPGTMVLKNTPGYGSSGSCVLNTDNEIVGINFAFIEESGKRIGFAVVTTPKLLERLRSESKVEQKEQSDGAGNSSEPL